MLLLLLLVLLVLLRLLFLACEGPQMLLTVKDAIIRHERPVNVSCYSLPLLGLQKWFDEQTFSRGLQGLP